VVWRSDGQFAYQLAVVVDDAEQRVSHVVRGADLLDSTPRQIHLQRLLGLPEPAYLHIPVAVDDSGAKLSKQTRAEAIRGCGAVLRALLTTLNHAPPADIGNDELLAWAIAYWHPTRLPAQRTLVCRM
jgi:glutamyl-Q tRNA(Asp) synthetase